MPQKAPSFEEEVAKFKGFATNNGAVAAAEKSTDTDEDKAAYDDTEGVDDEDEAQEDSTESQADEGGEDEHADERPRKHKPYHRTAEGRVKQALRDRQLAERRAMEAEVKHAELERRFAELERRLTEKSSQDTNSDSGVPKPDDFEYGELDARYIRALAHHEAKQGLKAELAEQARTRQGEAAQRQAAEDTEKLKTFLDAGSEKIDDFDEVVIDSARAGEWPLSDTLGRLAVESEHGYDVLYHLASNPKEARSVYGKSPAEQAAYFGRLEAKFASASAAKSEDEKSSVKTTKAPPPPKNTARGAGGKFKVTPATKDFRSFEAMWRASRSKE